ncbi:hypothetical protein FALBO_5402 [Fusarium albosuccineum]|uniref:Uncharacterized protein n=1 Tax=Fusarium albosuccineum TaxID=1237068 RepID=A0A8H4LDM6_9HYPO|nr:hypothetical protein FALBO_5402 [Fusarium albosuccineum]
MAQKDGIVEVEQDSTCGEDVKAGVDPPGAAQHKFMPGDGVFLHSRMGPYWIERAENGSYSLCDDKGNTINGGTLYQESELVPYIPGMRTTIDVFRS